MFRIVVFSFFIINFVTYHHCFDVDSGDNVVFEAGFQPQLRVDVVKNERYILYEVNPGEGFNLRRDVYMRIANLVVKLNKRSEEFVLVLPPWGRIYHWKSQDVGIQMKLPWSLFFDVASLNLHVPVIEFEEYLKRIGDHVIEDVYYLQHYAEGWTSGNWVEKMDERPCNDRPIYLKDNNGSYQSWFWGYEDVYAKNFSCLSIQGHSSTLLPLFTKSTQKSILIDRAETILHDEFGSSLYWKARRSMRFSLELRAIGDRFREKYLNSTDELDNTDVELDWRTMKRQHGVALGGPYVAAHLRRADFLYGHKNDVPSLKFAAKQIQEALQKLNLTNVFIATDATSQEVDKLKSYLPNIFTFITSPKVKQKYKDGGVAIIDQWICAHARHFIGTHESTFSFRIHEEREILGFHPDTTFNRFCPQEKDICEQPARWKIVY